MLGKTAMTPAEAQALLDARLRGEAVTPSQVIQATNAVLGDMIEAANMRRNASAEMAR